MANTPRRQGSAGRFAVIGAGAVGLSCALRLKQASADVTVYERHAELGAGASQRSAGMLSAAFESAMDRENRALVAFSEHAARIWPEFAAEVERLGGGGIEFGHEGSLVCAQDGEEERKLQELAAAIQARGAEARWLGMAEARRLEPSLTGSLKAALHLPGDRQVEAPLLLQRLGAALQRIGVALRFGRSIEAVKLVTGGFLLPDNEKFDGVVLATGAGPGGVKVIDRFGEALETGVGPVVPVKGQMAAMAVTAGTPRHVIRMRDVYVAPKQRWVLVGASVERGRTDVVVDRAVIETLKDRAAALIGGLKDAPEISAWAGVRPGTEDDAPMIGATAVPGLVVALGCYRNGILLSPAVGELVAGLALDGKVSGEGKAFDPLRFDKLAPARHSR